MTAFDIQVDPMELARIMGNALAFWPARTTVTTGRLQFGPETITATGTDTYTAGRDSCRLREPHGPEGVLVEIGRVDWVAVERQARKGKGDAARLTYLPGDGLIFHPSSKTDAETVHCADMTGQGTRLTNGVESVDVWTLVDELLERLGDGVRLTFDPEYLGRFKKIRPPDDWEPDAVLDLMYQGDDSPLLARVGPSFVGAIMPIDRGEYVVRQGDEAEQGLW